MSKSRESKLDQFAERLTDWFLAGKTLAQAQEQLRLDGLSVSLSRLSDWWSSRQSSLMQERLLSQIASGARQCQQVEKAFGDAPAPELETLIKLHRVLILNLSTQANANPKFIELVTQMMKPVMDYAKLEEKRREQNLAEQKYRDLVSEKREAIQRTLDKAKSSGGISQETREKIERELKLL